MEFGGEFGGDTRHVKFEVGDKNCPKKLPMDGIALLPSKVIDYLVTEENNKNS